VTRKQHLTDLKKIHRVLDQDPTDVLSRLALADLYEEEGDLITARAWRWLAAQKKWPYDWAKQPEYDCFKTFDWYQGEGAVWAVPPSCHVPPALWPFLRRKYPEGNWADYRTRRAAEDALVRAYRRAVKAGCAPS
jgi:hypothetical protein